MTIRVRDIWLILAAWWAMSVVSWRLDIPTDDPEAMAGMTFFVGALHVFAWLRTQRKKGLGGDEMSDLRELIKQAIALKDGNKEFILSYMGQGAAWEAERGASWTAEIGNTASCVSLGEAPGEYARTAKTPEEAVGNLIAALAVKFPVDDIVRRAVWKHRFTPGGAFNNLPLDQACTLAAADLGLDEALVKASIYEGD